jgi:tetratricopeptide (TPR) repeat protein
MPGPDLSYLREPPDSAASVPPPPGEREADLPLGEMGWKNFERLCLAYAETTGDFVDVSFYGTEGQSQQGIDLVLRYADTKQLTVQCRRIKTISAAKIRKAVDDFLAGRFANSSKRFALATAADTSSNKIQDEVDEQFKRLAEKGIEFELWGRGRISEKLREQPQLLLRFFGEPWHDLYRPDLAKESIKNTVEAQGQRVVDALTQSTDEIAATIRSVEQLGAAQNVEAGVSPEVLDRVTDLAISSGNLEPDVAVILAELHQAQRRESMQLIGAGVERDVSRARQLILVPPAWVKAGSAALWNALGRLAAAAGDWAQAEQAFLSAADVASGPRAIFLVRAHDVARADGRGDDAAKHLADAKLLEPELVAVRLGELDEIDDPTEQLRLLDELQPTSDGERALVARARTDALARLRRYDEALGQLDVVIENRATRMAGLDRRAGITVLQQGEALAEGREPDRAALRLAAEDSARLGDRLRARGRLAESGQCVARAADALALAGDSAQALKLIGQLTAGERETEGVRLAACQAAIHARNPKLALAFLGPEADWSAEERYAAAHALVLSDDSAATARAVQIAREALDAGREPERAAFVLLMAAMNDTEIPWPQDAAAIVEARDPVMHAQMRAERLLAEDRVDEAEEVLLAHADDVEVMRTIADRHLAAERWPAALAVAERLIKASGRGDDRMRRAGALRGLGRRDALLAELRSLAEDAAQPDELRQRAFRALSAEVASRDYPELARLSEEWRTALPDDPDALAQSIFSLARLARHGEALELIAERDMEPRTVAEAQLMAEVFFRAAPPLDAARRIAALSDHFDRPEPLEGLLLMASVRAPKADAELAQRIGETYRTFEQRFPDSQAIRSLTFDEDNPEAFLEMIREQLRDRRERANQLHTDVRRGDAALALLAAGTGSHIGEITLRLEALPLGYGIRELDEHELQSAREAIGQLAVWDPVSLTVVAGLPETVRRLILARLPGSSIATSTLAEVDAAVGALTGSAEQGVMSLEGEQVAMSTIPAEQLDREREILTGALALARDHMLPLVDVDPAAPDALDVVVGADELDETLATWPATVSVARRQGAAVYSDDRFVRLSARREGVPAFGTLALLTVLGERGALSEEQLAEQRLALGRRGAWGLRPSGEELGQLAAEHGWQPTGGWAQALADPAAWLNEPDYQLRLNVEFLRQLHGVQPDALEAWAARVVDLGRHASSAFDADDVAVGLLVYGWLSPGAFADLNAHRAFTLALVRALRAAARRLHVAAFDDLVERAAATAIFSTDPRLRGEMFKWILRQVTFLDGKLLFDFFG